jgi:hypothetical protein
MKDEEFKALKEGAWARNKAIKAQAEEIAALKEKLAASKEAVADVKSTAAYETLPKEVRDKLEALEAAEDVKEETVSGGEKTQKEVSA